jgi:hypothetical protein
MPRLDGWTRGPRFVSNPESHETRAKRPPEVKLCSTVAGGVPALRLRYRQFSFGWAIFWEGAGL